MPLDRELERFETLIWSWWVESNCRICIQLTNFSWNGKVLYWNLPMISLSKEEPFVSHFWQWEACQFDWNRLNSGWFVVTGSRKNALIMSQRTEFWCCLLKDCWKFKQQLSEADFIWKICKFKLNLRVIVNNTCAGF